MATVDVNGTLIDFPDNLSPDQLQSAVAQAAGQISGKPQQDPSEKPKPQDLVELTDPINLLKSAAPSKVLKSIGVAAANAPGAASLVLSGLPGGNLADAPAALKNVKKNPGQVLKAIKRVAQVEGGAPLSQPEELPAKAGTIAGTLMEMTGPTMNLKSIKASGPFTAGLKRASTAIPGSFKRAGNELGLAKEAAGAGVDSPQVAEILNRIETPKGAKSILSEARQWVQSGMKGEKSPAMLLAYKEALGQAQSEGGTFADVYAKAAKKVGNALAKKSPKLASAMETMADNFAAKGNPKASFPFFTTALNLKVGAAKAATLPIVRNAAGAATNQIVSHPIQLAALAKTLTEDKVRDYLRRAKNDPDKARQMAKADGYEIK